METENGDEVIVSMKELTHYLEIAAVRYASVIGADCPELLLQLNHLKEVNCG